MHDIIMDVAVYLIAALGIVILRVVWPWVKKQTTLVEAKLKAENHELAASIIREAVNAAEQTIQGVQSGGEKKEKARELIQQGLSDSGITLSDDEIDRMIEAFVGEMNQGKAKIGQ